MPAKLSEVERIAGRFGVELKPLKTGRHPFKFTKDGRVWPVKAHRGMHSELSDVYVNGLCDVFQINRKEFWDAMRGIQNRDATEIDLDDPRATVCQVDGDDVRVYLDDGRCCEFQITSYERLRDGTAAARSNVRVTSKGKTVHWPDLDEDLSVDELVRTHGAQ